MNDIFAIINPIKFFAPKRCESCSAAVIVAHPDDETLWAGGKILSHPKWNWFILSLCRGSDADRAPKFFRALNSLNALGNLANLNDDPEQPPIQQHEMEKAIIRGLPDKHFDLILTHGPQGEYTRHRRHEEVSAAVMSLWQSGRLSTQSMMMFAYEDGNRAYLPRPRKDAHLTQQLSRRLWKAKYEIITKVYEFSPDSWEARTTPREEAFWMFDDPISLAKRFNMEGVVT
ncbi:MAG: PIG-L family deacetylase [Planctomycetota bacterium]|jgi:LmbE family N-acetylglucosaminyl deacetylase